VGAETVERTFCFVDLAGFTALTEAHGDLDAVDLLDRFAGLTRQSLSPGDELVKMIGDAVMLTSLSPAAGIAVLASLLERCSEANGFPLLRAGAHHGPAVRRGGDYLGATVNLAARVAGHAGGGQVLATSAVADAARRRGIEVAGLGSRRLRNLAQPVELFEIRLGGHERSSAIDPVCRMRVEPEHAPGSLSHAGQRFWFCSVACVAAFAADPDRYIVAADPPERGGRG
jgi:class 3 adenylate cyclase/YHS domain-containing protein